MYKPYLALNNLQWLKCQQTKANTEQSRMWHKVDFLSGIQQV